MQTFYWHDYETWGTSPSTDWPCQFAGIRTDQDLNILGEPLNIQCRPPEDCLPNLEAALVTGLSPVHVAKAGLVEHEFFAKIHSELAKTGTCGVGYNSIRFDDEVTRYGFYRNFYDPYAREWQNGCSRWDLVDLVRLCYAVRPDGFEWPMVERDDGELVPSMRLESICAQNGIEHIDAHDALSDVEATIALARKIKALQPKMFDYVLSLKDKRNAAESLALGEHQMRLHISSKFGAYFGNASLILPLVRDPLNKNEIHCVDLRYSPEPLLRCSAKELADLRFRRLGDMPEEIERIPLKSVHLNKSPIVLTPKLVSDAVAARCKLDVEVCERNRKMLLQNDDIAEKVSEMSRLCAREPFTGEVETQLYGGFIGNRDRRVCEEVVQSSEAELASREFLFEDRRLGELLFRYRARNFPSSLGEDEAAMWVYQERLRLIEAWRALEAEQRQLALTSTKPGQPAAASPVTAAPKPVGRTKAVGRSQPMAGAQQFRMLQRELDRNRD